MKARLRDGVSVAQARDEVAGIGLSLQRRYPATNERQTLITRTHLQARAVERGPATVLVAMLLTLAIVVLVVACANVAGLLTSRAPARARELAVRLAIGAGRGRIVRQLITESLLIAAAGAALGIGLGVAGIRLLQQRQIVSDIGVRLTLAVDERVIGFSILAAALSTFVAGLVPAIRAARLKDLLEYAAHVHVRSGPLTVVGATHPRRRTGGPVAGAGHGGRVPVSHVQRRVRTRARLPHQQRPARERQPRAWRVRPCARHGHLRADGPQAWPVCRASPRSASRRRCR